ncbi:MULTISPECIES: alpha-ketoglutarate-dependent dioxygenase AlkB family protein [Flavobacterium]|uniref:Alpha-ketoglutarate-dependent dioxygenase AlkB n=2 Tax=Flavobacterium TaxID=237 RepID=A0AA94F138_9FLAO|nr:MULTISPECIES: alpha-ketoglutarate-dependent dioxygenase AlkB [Flavobacterium]OXA82698.1 alpha-ketoglutarate-dependent dioxygenase AlkB [Flavobacterium columnare NBRC 100251 = ATCC 23463]AMA49344.1 2OG-Fe(II) oxygenase [Flavobacterium covae]AND63044.1 2OG-Fe(II) oxygenase [Flavobacterium covae]MCH4828599.1 alpha-ketoglutarate-dependent dioxygenase AlkB [Flavobacterium columnare]MCH4831852.1 alpha-ketoglutarate-dependent dioxygenase AlkB [Flavobacterium columnare]
MLFPDEKIEFLIPDAELIYYPSFFSLEQANILLKKLESEIPWQQDKITVYGKEHFQPRLTALFGNEGKPYAYSNIVMRPHPWTPLLTHIKDEVERVCDTHFTTVLLNNYRNGQDSMGWHSDNEKELGRNPIIASVSFGAERNFQLKHNSIETAKQNIHLQHGSLLIMQGAIQHFWKHQVPKTQKNVGARINLTFRVIK